MCAGVFEGVVFYGAGGILGVWEGGSVGGREGREGGLCWWEERVNVHMEF